MKRFLISISCILALLSINSCRPTGKENVKKAAKGDRIYGGALYISEVTPVMTLYPYYIYDNVSEIVASQIYDGLVRMNPKDLSVVSGIAARWSIDSSGTVYTFHLRNNVFFQDDPCFPDGKGRKVTASDFKYSMEKLCTASPSNAVFSATFKDNVVGADAYYRASEQGTPAKELQGVQVVNDTTLEIKLVKPNPLFLNVLAGPAGYVISKEALEKYGKGMHLGAGPFVYSSASDSSKIILTRNPNYYMYDTLGNQLPFLDTVVISFISNKMEEFKEFQEGKLDYIRGVPASQVPKMVEQQISDFQHKPPKYVLWRVPEMGTQYYSFNLTKPPFNDIRVRKAFSYAINRNKIVNEVLEGEAFAPGTHGITPPSFVGYPQDSVMGDTLNVPLAQKLLSEAGYKDGKNFPPVTLELNSGGGIYTTVAVEVQKELYNNLNININFTTVPFDKKLQDERYGNFQLIRSGWIADYPSPADFLMLFYGGNIPDSSTQAAYYNSTRYKNVGFDNLYNLGRSATNKKVAYEYYKQAEDSMMKDAPVIILWYEQNYSLSWWKVKNLYPNPMNYLDLSAVYIGSNEAVPAKTSSKSSIGKK